MSAPKRYDVIGLGCTAVDEILYVPAYPAADDKVEVRQRERHCGGLCATALVAAARLGGRCAYAGTLGTDADEASAFVARSLLAEGIDLGQCVRRSDARPVQSVIVVDETRRTRTILYHTARAFGAHPTRPGRSFLQSGRVLLVDRFGVPGMIRAARLARAAGIPVVADFESANQPRFQELLALADHLILSREFAARMTGARGPSAAAVRLWRKDRAVVIVTAGADGCWFTQDGRAARRFPAYRVVARDTTGCGDVFHGAYALGLARGLDLPERLALASASAALKATRHGGQAGIARLSEVRRLAKNLRLPADSDLSLNRPLIRRS
jgi:sugar/nucleoside kinase (ribokinase family)